MVKRSISEDSRIGLQLHVQQASVVIQVNIGPLSERVC